MGSSRKPSPRTHTHTAHPSHEWRGTSGARTRTPQHPSQEWQGAAKTGAQGHPPTPHTPARGGGAPAARAHKHKHSPTPKPGVGGRSRNPSPSTHTHAAHPRQEWLGTSGASTQTRRPQRPSHEGRGAAKTKAQAHTPTQHTSVRSGGVQAKHPHKHTHTPTPQRGVVGRSRNPSPSTHTHE